MPKKRLSAEKSDLAKKCKKLETFFTKKSNAVETEPEVLTTLNDDNTHDTEQNDVVINDQNMTPCSSNTLGTSKSPLSVQSVLPTSEFYKGYQLSIKHIIEKEGNDILEQYKEKTGSKQKTRTFVKCLVCHECLDEIRHMSRNKQVYIADGIRCDGERKLKEVIDHLHSEIHKAALDQKNRRDQWKNKDISHPWLTVVRKTNKAVIDTLVHMAVDSYNDSKTLTLAAWSWPSRSLAQLHANRQCQIYDVDNDFSFVEFEVPSTKLHYRDPVHYNEMLGIQGDFERSNLKEELRNCLKFSVQMDGSVDTKQHDNKFIFIRFNTRKNPLDIKTRFLSAKTSDSRGAEGLFNSFVSSLTDIGIDSKIIKEKFAGLTTDGESANTGRESGLWTRVENFVGSSRLNIWCTCHRSDLAMEDMFASVSELKLWQSNLTAVASYYRSSGLRTKELIDINEGAKSYPPHHEVRFAQHLISLCEAVLDNLEDSRQHWQKILDSSTQEYNRKEIFENMED